MKKIFTLITIFALIFSSSFVYAQNKIGKVTGIAKSADGKPLDGATIGLLRAKDNSLVISK